MIQLQDRQSEYLETVKDRHVFACETGVGKTFLSLAHAERENAQRILVIAPPALIKGGQWKSEAEAYLEGREWKPEIEFVTYYWLQQYVKNSKGLRNDTEPFDHIILDEGHRVKNSQSLQGLGAYWLLRDMPEAKVSILTATPTPNGYHDMCNYFKMFGFTKNKTEFYKRYVNETRFKGYPEIIGYNRTDELDRLWNEISTPLVADFPFNKKLIPVNMKIPTKYIKAMATMKDENGELLDNPSKLAHYCRQACGSAPERLEWISDFIADHEDNIVIFTAYVETAKKIAEIAKKHKRKVYTITGEKKDYPRVADAPEKGTVTVVNYQAGGVGVNLQYAHLAIFAEPTYSYADYKQAIGRIYRTGQKHNCVMYLFRARNTIETAIWRAIKNKTDFNERTWADEQAEKGV